MTLWEIMFIQRSMVDMGWHGMTWRGILLVISATRWCLARCHLFNLFKLWGAIRFFFRFGKCAILQILNTILTGFRKWSHRWLGGFWIEQRQLDLRSWISFWNQGMREWSIITSNTHPSNPHSLRCSHQKKIIKIIHLEKRAVTSSDIKWHQVTFEKFHVIFHSNVTFWKKKKSDTKSSWPRSSAWFLVRESVSPWGRINNHGKTTWIEHSEHKNLANNSGNTIDSYV